MPKLTNIKSLQWLLGMAQYLSKFLPQLSVVSNPLRQLECKGTDWKWSEIHDKAATKIKSLICKALVLRYFDPTMEITLQRDVSNEGIGYALLQQGQPVAFGSHGLTQAEKVRTDRERDVGNSVWM